MAPRYLKTKKVCVCCGGVKFFTSPALLHCERCFACAPLCAGVAGGCDGSCGCRECAIPGPQDAGVARLMRRLKHSTSLFDRHPAAVNPAAAILLPSTSCNVVTVSRELTWCSTVNGVHAGGRGRQQVSTAHHPACATHPACSHRKRKGKAVSGGKAEVSAPLCSGAVAGY